MKACGFGVLRGCALLLSLTACQAPQFPTLSVYESPTHFVRLEADPRVGSNKGHAHPVSLTQHEMEAVLSGLMIEEPPRLLSRLMETNEPRRHPAFTDAEIQFLVPLLVKGLALATPEEVVTFYQTHQETAIIRKVTSGGMFVQGEEIHIVLANYRSPTHYASDPGVADTTDDRLSPMRPIAPQEATLDFEPPTMIVAPAASSLTNMFSRTSREVVVLFRQVPLRKSDPAKR